MKENHNDNTDVSQQLAELEWDTQPRRDLWPDIASKIRFADRRLKIKQRWTSKSVWVPTAIAASLVLVIGTVMFNSVLYQQNLANQKYQAAMALYQEAQLQLIEQQHQTVRLQLAGLLNRQNANLSPDFVAEVEKLMQNIDSAASEIKKAISSQPNNPNYTSLLVRTYQQELKLLNRVETTPDTTI
ncbi:MAG: hypothetical protein KJP04_10225 [Arenicella sp.]|nr:hypothetical protein [Arenicella sp.]